MPNPSKIFIDIETIPAGDPIDHRTLTPPGSLKKPESIAAWYADTAPQIAADLFRKRALDSMTGEILCLGFTVDDEEPRVEIRQQISSDNGLVLEPEEAVLLRMEAALRTALKNSPMIWVGHNALTFDCRWIWRRAIKYDRPWLAQAIQLDRYRGNVRDTMLLWGGGDSRDYCKLDSIAAFLGLGGKMEGVDGSQIWDLVQMGQFDTIAAYCRQDVALTREVYRRLAWEF